MKDWTVPWLRVPPNVPTGRNIGKRTVESFMRSDSNAAQSCRAAKPDNTMIPKGKATSIAALGLLLMLPSHPVVAVTLLNHAEKVAAIGPVANVANPVGALPGELCKLCEAHAFLVHPNHLHDFFI